MNMVKIKYIVSIHMHVRDIHVHVDSLTKGEDDDKNETDEPDHML